MESLAAPRVGGRYPQPSWDGRALPSITVTAYQRAGKTPESPLATPLDKQYTAHARDGDTSVVLLIDSFGWGSFEALQGSAVREDERRVARLLSQRTLPFSTVFPSTTSSALHSLSTGTTPGTHGIAGYYQYFPQWGDILNTISLSPQWLKAPRDAAVGPSFQPNDWIPVPTIFQRHGGGCVITESAFEGSAFTRTLYAGASFTGYRSLSDLGLHLRRTLNLPASKRPKLIWVYWDLLDTVNHEHGPLPELAVRELTNVFQTLGAAAADTSVPSREGVHLFVTGDHGHMTARPELAQGAHEDPTLMALLERPPSGERRAAFLKAKAGRLEEVKAHLSTTLPKEWLVLPVPSLIDQGLFGPGPHHSELRDRLGDLLVLPSDEATYFYRPPGFRGPDTHFLNGTHGGLSPRELLVPLVSTSWDDVARMDV